MKNKEYLISTATYICFFHNLHLNKINNNKSARSQIFSHFLMLTAVHNNARALCPLVVILKQFGTVCTQHTVLNLGYHELTLQYNTLQKEFLFFRNHFSSTFILATQLFSEYQQNTTSIIVIKLQINYIHQRTHELRHLNNCPRK